MSINPALIVIMIPNLMASIKNWLKDFPEAMAEISLKIQIQTEEIKVCDFDYYYKQLIN